MNLDPECSCNYDEVLQVIPYPASSATTRTVLFERLSLGPSTGSWTLWKKSPSDEGR